MTLPLLTVPLLAAQFLTGSLVAGPALPVDSTPPAGRHLTAGSGLPAIQAAGADATARRIASLHAAVTRVTANPRLTDADRSTILGTLNADLTAMTTLQQRIAADSTAASAWTDYQSIFTGYRVYAVAIPQALVAAGADGLTGTGIPKLQEVAGALAPKAASHPELQPKLDDMNARIQAAQSDVDGLAAEALAVTPVDYNGNSAVMGDLRARLRDAIAAAKQAAQDGRAIVQGLR